MKFTGWNELPSLICYLGSVGHIYGANVTRGMSLSTTLNQPGFRLNFSMSGREDLIIEPSTIM